MQEDDLTQTSKEHIMSNNNQNTQNTGAMNKSPGLTAKIKETWNKMGDDDVKLYNSNPEKFFSLLQEKHHVSKADAEKKITELQKMPPAPNDHGKSEKTDAA
jgi:hypothetical protein